ncbi:DUF222 domain-containing protein [Microbacterium sp. NPDC088619]|uniref:DUF222 domain-containing protein n=1 Tax=Microbacterium sp. NPDC088619 TaxID=3364196 RepID=UPI003828A038
MAQRTDLDLDLEERRRLLDDWLATRRRIAALEAESYALLVERIRVHDTDVSQSPHHRDAIYRSMIAEYSAAGHIPKGSVEYAFTDARTLSRALPAVFASFAAGSITAHHVREIVRASEIVDDAIRDGRVEAATMGLYEAAVLVVAEQDTASRTKPHARKVAARLVGETVVETQRRATAERCVTVRSVGDGLAALTAILPEWVAVAISDRLTRMARHIAHTRDEREPILAPLDDESEASLRLSDLSPEDPRYDAYFETGVIAADGTFVTDPLADLIDPMTDPASPDIEHLSGDTRTFDQIRADLLSDLLLSSDPSRANGTGLENVSARIQVTVAASTLAGHDDRPAELDGHGPLDPDVARRLAGHCTGWSRLFLDATGLVTETDSYSPTAQMKRFLRARDEHCRFPRVQDAGAPLRDRPQP